MNRHISTINTYLSGLWQNIIPAKTGVSIEKTHSTFWVMVKKDMADHVKSWRFVILITIIFLTSFGSLYAALSHMPELAGSLGADNRFFFLLLFSASDGTIPPLFVLLAFMGPLIGLSMGFDAINMEQNKGTLSRILAQPVPRDYVINSKFVSSLIIIGIMVVALTMIVSGAGLRAIGIPPSADEFMRIIIFTIITIIYIAFWLNLAILFSVRFRQPATSALAGIAIWLFFAVFYPLIVNVVTQFFEPSQHAPVTAFIFYENLKAALTQIIPGELYNQTVATILTPTIRSIGPLTMEQLSGTIPGALPLGQSLLVIWPQLTGLITLKIGRASCRERV